MVISCRNINQNIKLKITLTKLVYYKPKKRLFSPIRSITSNVTYAANPSQNSVIWKARAGREGQSLYAPTRMTDYRMRYS